MSNAIQLKKKMSFVAFIYELRRLIRIYMLIRAYDRKWMSKKMRYPSPLMPLPPLKHFPKRLISMHFYHSLSMSDKISLAYRVFHVIESDPQTLDFPATMVSALKKSIDELYHANKNYVHGEHSASNRATLNKKEAEFKAVFRMMMKYAENNTEGKAQIYWRALMGYGYMPDGK